MSEPKRKTVSIRGVEEDLYRKALILARESGKTIGEVINEAIKLFLATVETSGRVFSDFVNEVREGFLEGSRSVMVVCDLGELSVSSSDLEASDKPIVFRNVKKLRFEADVPFELFENKVLSIVFCDEVVFPKNFPKLKALAKCKYVRKTLFE